MANKSTNVYIRIEPDVKSQAERILADLGLPASTAINLFYKQIILHRGLPFEVTLPDQPGAEPVADSAPRDQQKEVKDQDGLHK